jgi:CRISPR-associated protein Csb2
MQRTYVQTLSKLRYVAPARFWATVTPVVHSRWQKGEGTDALAAQVRADCAHVGLPDPVGIERLRTSALCGGGNRVIPVLEDLRPEWRRSAQGPRSHLLLEFDREVVGPILLGKARHFGLGLCLPIEKPGTSD